MVKHIAALSAGLLTLSAALALPANNDTQKASFKSGVVSMAQVRKAKLAGAKISLGQLYVCNLTNLPNQTGVPLLVSFVGTNTPDQPISQNSCAYLTGSTGFLVEAKIYATINNNNYLVDDQNMSDAQMWSVTYNANTNTYPLVQIQ